MNWILELFGRSLPIVLGAGAVQLGIFLLKRRSELAALDAATTRTGVETGAVVVTSAEKSVQLADTQRDNAIVRANEAIARAAACEIQLVARVKELMAVMARLAAVEIEVERLRETVADLHAGRG